MKKTKFTINSIMTLLIAGYTIYNVIQYFQKGVVSQEYLASCVFNFLAIVFMVIEWKKYASFKNEDEENLK